MRIGGTAAYYAELLTDDDVVQSRDFAKAKHIPLIPLGNGSNTLFADGEIAAFVVQVKHATVAVEGQTVTIGAGKNLPMLINELAALGLDLSALTGIPGTIGGAIFGNAGQGPKGMWIDSFVHSVTAFFHGEKKTLTKEECAFRYRESVFKESSATDGPIIWEAVLTVPCGEPPAIEQNIQSLLQKRIETQPHAKTAGSCFKAVGDTPAWKLLDAAGLRGHRVGGVGISPKHANFLMNVGEGTYNDAVAVVEMAREKIPDALEVEMRFIESDGSLRFS